MAAFAFAFVALAVGLLPADAFGLTVLTVLTVFGAPPDADASSLSYMISSIMSTSPANCGSML
jgi:hypothetical protein